MIRKISVFLFITSFLFSEFTKIYAQKENYISVIIPEDEITTTSLSKYRLAANTLPGSSVTINDENIKVYNSGAFVNLLKLEFGENIFKIISTKDGEKITKEFTIIREEKKLKTTNSDELIIEDNLMMPSEDLWLDAGDILEVKIKGTPDCNATFMNGIKMIELPEKETKGVRGIYTGIYKVTDNDNLENLPITFSLEKDGEIVTKNSKAKVSLIPTKLPRVAITKGERPSLNYGLGTDRLGGSKLSFLEEGIKLIINGMYGDQYRVKLTDNLVAYISKDQVDLLQLGTHLPISLTDSWAAYGGKNFDKIIINLNEKLPFSTRQEINPTRIIVDIYGATSNSNWITQHLTTEGIKNLNYEQVENNLFRITIEPKRKQIWGYKIGYKNSTLEIEIKKQPEILKFDKLSFVLDAGHGGENNGALGATGLLEKNVTLDIVNRLEKMLIEKGAKVYRTREDDTYTLNGERLQKIFSFNADILISIHANSIGYNADPVKISGTSTYYKHIAFRPLSLKIYERMLELGLEPFGNVGNFNFTLNSPTEILNVLVETAFMSNPNDEIKLMDSEFKDKMCKQIIQGVQDFLYECEDNWN
ncbi:MAG: N-acetylmuramoyl-L-alanine amidase [Ignavibacteriae bacterium]|nr:N-acetylmuramoyl-L-alanine amidase [Ignavibacteriota bacterium]